MGEEKKEEVKKEESKEENKEKEKKEENKEEEEQAAPEIVLKVDMHCQACARKVARALKGFEGVEDVIADSRASKVVVKGKKADPMKVCERLQKKSGRKVELISPLPTPPDQKTEDNKPEQPKEDKKDEPPAVITVVLKVRMHCEACAQVLQKRIRKIKGVESVETDVGNDKVVVKGVVEPSKLVDYVYKRTGKQALIMKEEEKKEEENKEEEMKKDEKESEKKDGEDGKGGEEEEDDTKFEIKRSEYWTSKYESEYAYPTSQFFSDENPNACSVM